MKRPDYTAWKPLIHVMERLIQCLWPLPLCRWSAIERLCAMCLMLCLVNPNLAIYKPYKMYWLFTLLDLIILYYSKHHIPSFNLKSAEEKSSEVALEQLLNFLLLMRPTDQTSAQHPFLRVIKRQIVGSNSRIEWDYCYQLSLGFIIGWK